MRELCYCPPSYGGGSGMNSMMAMIPESFLLFIGPMACGRFSATNTFIGEGKNGYLYITDADIALGKVNYEIFNAVDTVLEKYKPKVLILLLTCDVMIAGIDEDAVLKELGIQHPGTVFQSFPINHIANEEGRDPIDLMYVRALELMDRSETIDAVDFVGSSMPPKCGSDIIAVLGELGIPNFHTAKAASFDDFKKIGHARYNVLTGRDGQFAVKNDDRPYCVMFPTYSFDEVRQQYDALFAMIGKTADLAVHEERAKNAVSKAAAALSGKTVSLGSSVTKRAFGLARLMLENGIDIRNIFLTEESYSRSADLDVLDRKWVTENYPEIAVQCTDDTGMVNSIGNSCKVDVSIGFNASYMSDSEIVINVTDNGQVGYWPIVNVFEAVVASMENPKNMKELMASYGVVI